jgi:para-nitrobenzyl esterase
MWGPACLQVLGPKTTYGSEDCLVANVWQPATAKPGEVLPVMVFVFGGSNQFGEAEPYNMSGLAVGHTNLQRFRVCSTRSFVC